MANKKNGITTTILLSPTIVEYIAQTLHDKREEIKPGTISRSALLEDMIIFAKEKGYGRKQ